MYVWMFTLSPPSTGSEMSRTCSAFWVSAHKFWKFWLFLTLEFIFPNIHSERHVGVSQEKHHPNLLSSSQPFFNHSTFNHSTAILQPFQPFHLNKVTPLLELYPESSKNTTENKDSSAVHAQSLQSCPTLCDPMDPGPPGSEAKQSTSLNFIKSQFEPWLCR